MITIIIKAIAFTVDNSHFHYVSSIWKQQEWLKGEENYAEAQNNFPDL